MHDPAGVRVDGQRAKGADDVDAEMAEETPIFGGEHRLYEMVGQFLERDRVVMLDPSPPDLDAISVEEGHREVLPLQPILVARFPIGGKRERDREYQPDEPDVQAFANEVDRGLCDSRDPKPFRECRDRLPRTNRAALRIEHRGIDERVEGQQGARDRLCEA